MPIHAGRRACLPLVPILALLVLAASPATTANADEVLLRRYAELDAYIDFNPGVAAHRAATRYRYMDAEDTYISAARPDANFGRSETLVLDDARDRVLLKFGRLYRAVPPSSDIREVELWLAPVEELDPDAIIEVRRVTLPWRDGGSRGQWQPVAATFRDRFAGEGSFRRPWTEPGGDADCVTTPGFSRRLGDCWDADRGVYVLDGAGLVEDVTYWLTRYYRNYGWLISVKHDDGSPVRFHASDVMTEAHRPTLRIVYDQQELTKPELPDLDVTFIERLPRYPRYHDNGRTSYTRRDFRGDRPGIMNNPDFDEYQKWPEQGDLVTFVAHIKNASGTPYHGPISYTWKINDRVVRAKGREKARAPGGWEMPPTIVDLAPWEEFTTRLTWEWDVDLRDHRKVVLEFEVDPEDAVEEVSEHNNAVLKYVAGKTLKFWVERSVYEYVKDYATCWGTYSYEDYLQWHMDVWNETYFDKSRFDDFAPDGAVLRTTLDDFQIVPDGTLGGGIHRPEDRFDINFDGEWGTEWAPFDTDDENALRGYFAFLQRHRVVLEPSLLHEMSHQVWGAYDIYWSNIEFSDPDNPKGKCKIKDETGHYITRGTWYIYGGLMGGDDTRPNAEYWYGTGLYSANSVGGANANARFRNGFYGDWQYDLPRECLLRLTSRDGVPLKDATLTLWQQTWKGIINDNLVAERVPANDQGIVKLPDQDSLEDADYTILTGHTLRKNNPWGRIDVVGQNITFCVQINAHGQRDYQFIRVLPFNRAYWSGHTNRFVLDTPCRISPSDRIDLDTNVARGARVSASRVSEQAKLVVDGRLETNWRGSRASAGDWIEIELPKARRVGVIRIVQDSGHGAFFRRFRMTTRAAAGAAEQFFDEQVPDPFPHVMNTEKDVNNERPSERWVSYAAQPRETKVIRIEALDGGDTHVSEIRVFAER